MKFTKIISAILATLMCIMALASCASDTGNSQHTRDSGDTGSDDGFVSVDYGGEDFTFLYIEQCREYYGGEYIDAESLTGDTIKDTVYARNLAVEEKYNVTITERDEPGNPSVLLQQFYMAGDFCFDVIYGWCYKLGQCITENFFTDFYNLPTADFTQEYWSPSSIEGMEVNGHLYVATPDISMNRFEWTDLMFFNKQLYEDYNLEQEFGNLYQLVDDGKWTIDTYLNIVQAVSNDVNGDGLINREDVCGARDDTGTWSYVSCDIPLTTNDELGVPTVSFYNEKFLNILDKFAAVYTSDKYTITWDEATADGDGGGAYDDIFKYSRSPFSTDHVVFMPGTPQITGEFRNMKSSYGVLPHPKYDEYQEKYHSGFDYNAAMFAIPITCRQDVSNASLERTSNILEYLAYKSNEMLLPAYYDTLLKGQRIENDDDSRMLDIIRDGVTINITLAAGIYTDNAGNNEISDVITAMYKKPSSATSTFKRKEKKLQKVIDDFFSEIVNLEALNAKNDSSES